MNNFDPKFLNQAIENLIKSMEEGNFPAGAVVARNDEILSQAISSPFPNLFHADSKAVSQAFEKYGPLKDAVLYVGFQPCLMCTGVAYWAGVRKIVYAVPKSVVSPDYYETPADTQKLFDSFNEKIEFIYVPKLQEKALSVVKKWEEKYLKK